MKTLHTVLRVILGLLLISPILGALGVFPPPTPDLYNTPLAFSFIQMLSDTGYMTELIAIVFAIALILTIMNRMAFVALFLFPITINIICFHAFLDGGLFTAGAIMGVVLFVINIYFLWKNCDSYKALFAKRG